MQKAEIQGLLHSAQANLGYFLAWMGLPSTIAAGLASAVILTSESCGTYGHILLSQIRDSPNLDG
jgi:hypothetical protein